MIELRMYLLYCGESHQNTKQIIIENVQENDSSVVIEPQSNSINKIESVISQNVRVVYTLLNTTLLKYAHFAFGALLLSMMSLDSKENKQICNIEYKTSTTGAKVIDLLVIWAKNIGIFFMKGLKYLVSYLDFLLLNSIGRACDNSGNEGIMKQSLEFFVHFLKEIILVVAIYSLVFISLVMIRRAVIRLMATDLLKSYEIKPVLHFVIEFSLISVTVFAMSSSVQHMRTKVMQSKTKMKGFKEMFTNLWEALKTGKTYYAPFTKPFTTLYEIFKSEEVLWILGCGIPLLLVFSTMSILYYKSLKNLYVKKNLIDNSVNIITA